MTTTGINSLAPRAALGLPEAYVPLRAEDLGAWTRVLQGESPERLTQRLERPDAELEERLAAGQLLALLGDPRIEPERPAMLRVRGGRARIGLDPAQLEERERRYASLGVLREWLEKELPSTPVFLPDFCIARFLVTNAEYLRFLRDTGGAPPSSWPLGRYPTERSNHPVHSLEPEAADAYASWLAARTGRAFRLPTEAEWEFAAAGAQRREFPWGDAFDKRCANTAELGLLTTTAVGSFPEGAAACGALDMAGNVEEYTACRYRPYPGGRVIEDDLFRADPEYRVTRGGSYARFADLARCARRHGRYRSELYPTGMRLAESI
jgi:formylglycine-generating enzyme required for sulfatase activity